MRRFVARIAGAIAGAIAARGLELVGARLLQRAREQQADDPTLN